LTVFNNDQILQTYEGIESINYIKNDVFDEVEAYYVLTVVRIKNHLKEQKEPFFDFLADWN